jgi:hypothetical protein
MFLLLVFILMNIGFLLLNPALTILPNHDLSDNNSITSFLLKEEAQILDLDMSKVIFVKIIFIPQSVGWTNTVAAVAPSFIIICCSCVFTYLGSSR